MNSQIMIYLYWGAWGMESVTECGKQREGEQ